MHPWKTLLKLGVIVLVASAALLLVPAMPGSVPVHSAQIAQPIIRQPGQPTSQSTAPDIVCPAGFDLAFTWERYPGSLDNALIFGTHPFDEYNFALGSSLNGTLVVWSVVGHPELGCPGGADPLCSAADQLNEHYNILLNGGLVDYVPDHTPDHTWAQYPNVNLGLLSAGNYTIRFEHAGNPAPSNSTTPSVGYKVGLCTQAPPPPPGDQGCTLGYWKNHTGSWQGYTPGQTLEDVFDVPDSLGIDNDTLLTALNYGGGPGVLGGARILLKQAVASLLNAANGGVGFPLSTADVIAQTNAALASLDRDTMVGLGGTFDGLNNLGCPLN